MAAETPVIGLLIANQYWPLPEFIVIPTPLHPPLGAVPAPHEFDPPVVVLDTALVSEPGPAPAVVNAGMFAFGLPSGYIAARAARAPLNPAL
jgi:hypothetical protein